MTNIKLDDIPDLVKSKKLSTNEACIQVYLILYTNPARFNIHDMDEDTRSDFLLYFLQKKAQQLLENYNPLISPFGAYIYKTIQTSRMTFCSKLSEKSNYSQICFEDSKNSFYEQMEYTENQVTDVAEPAKKFDLHSESQEIPQIVFKRIFQKAPHRLAVAESQDRKLKRGILILALKSAWYINDEQIQKVSTFCQIPPSVLTTTVCRLKSGLITKALNRKIIEDNRNRAYSFVRNYRMQLAQGEGSMDKIKFKRIQKKLDFQFESWFSKNTKLQSGSLRISPSNSEVASALGLTSRLVSFYMRKLKDIDPQRIADLRKTVNG